MVIIVPPASWDRETRISSLPELPWHWPVPLHSISALRPVGSAARFSTLKVAVPPDTVYFVIIQLGIVSDLSVHLPEGHAGVWGISMHKATLEAHRAPMRSDSMSITATININMWGIQWSWPIDEGYHNKDGYRKTPRRVNPFLYLQRQGTYLPLHSMTRSHVKTPMWHGFGCWSRFKYVFNYEGRIPLLKKRKVVFRKWKSECVNAANQSVDWGWEIRVPSRVQ